MIQDFRFLLVLESVEAENDALAELERKIIESKIHVPREVFQEGLNPLVEVLPRGLRGIRVSVRVASRTPVDVLQIHQLELGDHVVRDRLEGRLSK